MDRTNLTVQTILLFPEIIGLFDLERNLTADEMSQINANLKDLVSNESNSVSRNRNVLDHDHLSALRQFITDSIDTYLRDVCEEKTQLSITESWINKTRSGESHHYHCHPNSYLSGVFYVKTTDDDKITFFNNHPRLNYYQPVTTRWNSFNSKSWWLQTKQNTLLIFRSDLHHAVPQTINDERISLSFNSFIVSDFGDSQNATFLPLSN